MFKPVQLLNSRPKPKHVVIIPGHGGSILVNKNAPTRKIFDQDVIHNRWVSSDMLHPKHNQQWSRDISYNVERDPYTSKIIGYRDYNPLILPYDFGGVQGIQNISPELNLGFQLTQDIADTFLNHKYFSHLISSLESQNIPVSGAPYDFRIILDPRIRASYWNRLKDLIELKGSKVVLVGHSQGAILAKWFLQDMLSIAPYWVERYVSDIVMINAPFAGCPYSVRSVVQGVFYISVSMLEKIFMQHTEKNSGIVMGLPNTSLYSPDTLFWKQGPRSIYMRDIQKGRGSIAFEVWKDLYEPFIPHILSPIDVTSHLFVSKGKPTDVLYINNETITCDGDGIIPINSLLSYKHATKCYKLNNTSHSSCLRDPMLINTIAKLSNEKIII